jgi:hypothetical protein
MVGDALVVSTQSAIPCNEYERLLSEEECNRTLAIEIEQSADCRISLAQGGLLSLRQRHKHQKSCPICISRGLAEPMHPGDARGA